MIHPLHSPSRLSVTLSELARLLNAELEGDAELKVYRVAPIHEARNGDLTFLSNSHYRSQLASCTASAVIINKLDKDCTSLAKLVVSDSYAAFRQVALYFSPVIPVTPGISPQAYIHPAAKIDAGAQIDAFSYIGQDARVGTGTVIEAFAAIGDGAVVGKDCRIGSHCLIGHYCNIGDRTIINGGAIIGGDGFGLVPEQGEWKKIPQMGRVVIGSDVEIGANTTIDRGTLSDTIIGNGVKLDNLIQIGHNVVIGEHTAIAGCVGIAGSTKIGRHCTIGGAAMIHGHIDICDGAQISAATAITKSIIKPGVYTSIMPFQEHETWRRNAVNLRHLNHMNEKIKDLEQKLMAME
ncbi:MAG: UDP-3-O-(3-hydroxymyristoyl)glucosamine N-acyltransferase, partial [Pseudomonadota bacterium]|nr:UDP-3-O-(3-hydroxymyristoyl)glucosamine N-acyltransferase [Pseudomonadota bacterium]